MNLSQNDTEFWKWLAGVVIAAGGAVGGWFTARAKHRQEQRILNVAEKSAEIDDRQALIDAINTDLLDPLRKELSALRVRVDKLVERENDLLAFIYKLIGIIRSVGAINRIQPGDVPEGIHFEGEVS